MVNRKNFFPLRLVSLTALGVSLMGTPLARGTAVLLGQTMQLTVAADGTAPFVYQWYKDGAPLSGATAATYAVGSFQSSDAGLYHATVANAAGTSTSDIATLTLGTGAPTFTTQPGSQTVSAGATATFIAAAGGSPAPTFQWKFNGTAIPGATSATLSLGSVQLSAAGTYVVTASNSAGAATSNSALLTVNATTTSTATASAPAINIQPTSQTVVAGTTVKFQGGASGSPTPTYQWRFNGAPISGATSTTLTLKSAQASNAGSYTLVASNSAGSATSQPATLTIGATTSLPTITTQPVSQTITTGASVTFTVVAEGSPAPSFQWFRNGRKITRATNSTYIIAPASAADAANYTVVATNSRGSTTSAVAALTVNATSAPAVYRVDFNGDGQADIVWENSVTGQISLWLMSGTRLATTVSLGLMPAGVQLRGTGDFNGDNRSDLLWQNTLTGEAGTWLVSGTAIIGTVPLLAPASLGRICGTGDFNGDGAPDIVWHNGITGGCTIVLMNGTKALSTVPVGACAAPWQVTGVGDLNQDGQSDILAQNMATGETRVWLMTATVIGKVAALPNVTTDWQMTGTGDFNGDRRSDVLWQNLLSGAVQVWVMNSPSAASTTSLGTVTPDWILRN